MQKKRILSIFFNLIHFLNKYFANLNPIHVLWASKATKNATLIVYSKLFNIFGNIFGSFEGNLM